MERSNEEWKSVKGYEGLYEVSDLGNIRSEKGLLSQYTGGNYNTITLSKGGEVKTFAAHRLVATHFIPNPEDKPEVNHKWGDKNDNRAIALEWATRSENAQHAYDTGLISREKQSKARLGKKHLNSTKQKIKQSVQKVMLNLQTGIYYDSVTEAANSKGLKPNTFVKRVSRGAENSFIHV